MRHLIFPQNKPLILLGDNHGDWSSLFSLLDHNSVTNATLIHLGDDGIGFQPNKAATLSLCAQLNQRFKDRAIEFYSLRGNHCDPQYFTDPNLITMGNFNLIEDYTTGVWGDQTVQFVGGAISIDRKGRAPFISHWPNEGALFSPEKCVKVDILITHSCPPWCHPERLNSMVLGWAKIDPPLLAELKKEREILAEIFSLCQPKYHYYGHMHDSWNSKIGGCTHRLLAINELYEHHPIRLQQTLLPKLIPDALQR